MQMEVRKLTVGYGAAWVLDQVSLQIGAGEFVGIVGCTGCGKTTLLKAMAGLLEVQDGEILLDGENIFSRRFDRAVLRRKVGMVFQYPEYQLFEIDVLTDVAFGPKNLGLSQEESRKRAIDALQLVGIKEEQYTLSPFELSGGMNQRAGIMMAMASNPKILLADEPTSALDVTTQSQIIKEMMELRDKYNTSIMIVTHNLAVALYMADKIIVMKDGEVVDRGNRDEILNNPKSDYTKRLLASVPTWREERHA